MAVLNLWKYWRALVWLRLTLWKNRLRRDGSLLDRTAGILLSLLAVLGSVVLAWALGRILLRSWRVDGLDAYRVCLYIAFSIMTLFAVVIPSFLSGSNRKSELATLLIFPVRRRTLFGLALAAAVASAAQLFLYPAWLVLIYAAALRAPVPNVPGLIIVVLLALCLMVWGTAVLMSLEALMRRRSARELIGIAVFAVFMGLALLPALIDTGVLGRPEQKLWLDIGKEVVLPVVAVLPPSLAAEGLSALANGHSSWPQVVALLAWTAAGLLLAAVVFVRILLEPRSGGMPRRERAAGGMSSGPVHRFLRRRMERLPSTLMAVASKELRYLRRSTPGKLVVLLSPLFVVMIGLAVHTLSFVKKPLLGMDPGEYAFYGVLLYAGLFSSNFLVNSFAWEGSGIKAYLMGPLPARHVILGKNLAVLGFQLVVLLENVVVWSLIRGLPSATILVSGTLVFYTGLLVLMAAGNFVSIAFPVKRSIAAVTNSASNVGVLVSFAGVALSGSVVAVALMLGMAGGRGVIQVVVLAVLDGALLALNWVLLGPASELFEERAEDMIEVLQ